MSKNIDELSIEEIIRRVGFFNNYLDLVASFKFNGSTKQMSKFEAEVSNCIKEGATARDYLRLINKNENLFDKELYVFHLLRGLQAVYDKMRSPKYKDDDIQVPIFMIRGNGQIQFLDKKDIKEVISKAKGLLQNSDIVDLELYKNTGEIKVFESRRYVGKTTKADRDEKRANERLKEIDEKLGLENVLRFIVPTDLIYICKYPNLGNLLAVKIIELDGKKIDRNGTVTVQDRAKNIEYQVSDEEASGGRFYDLDKFYETVRENFKYMNIDKMLLYANTIFYNRYGNEQEKFSYEEAKQLKEFTKRIGELLEDKNVTISSPKFTINISYDLIKTSVDSLYKHFIVGKYYSEVEIEKLADEIMEGKVPVTVLSEEEFRDTMQFDSEELARIITSKPESLEELIKRGWINDKELESVLDNVQNINKDQLVYLYNSKKLSNEDFVKRYMRGQILLDDIDFLKKNTDKKDDLEKSVSSEELVSLYLNKDKKKDFVKYRDLYKTLRVLEKTLEEKKEDANEILEAFDVFLSEDKIQELYKMGLVPLDTYIEFVGSPAISNLYSKGELKPVDARRLFDENVITKDMIIGLLRKKEIDDGKKLTLIYSTFPEKEDESLRDEFIKYVKTDKKSAYNKSGNSPTTGELTIKGKKGSRYYTDPSARWHLMTSLDEEYSFEYKSDGSAIFYLPKQKKYIIEKLYNQNNEPAWGAATYILDEEKYEENKDSIIENDVVNRTNLANLRGEPGVKRVIHTGWSSAICKFFDIEDSSKYTEEQIKKIKKYSKQVEESKKPLERE